MAAPEVDTSWALETVAQEVLDAENNVALVLNKKEPTRQYKNEGLRAGVPVHGDSINYELYALHVMSEWHRQLEVGTILEFLDGTMTAQQLEDDRKGTWSDLGTLTKAYSEGNVVVRGFQKTA